MREIAPGLWHWTTRFDKIGIDVSSYLLAADRVVIDPMVPDDGLDELAKHGAPEHALMTNRHHDRDVWRLHDAFGTTVHCIRNGLHEIDGRGPVEPFDFGDQLPGGATAIEIGEICPDETALHIPAHHALACADGVVRWPGSDELTFVPDEYLDDPEDTKAALRAAYGRVADEHDFELLLLAHGDPVLEGGRDVLRAFAAG
jgi:hypothetical protein